MVTVHGHLATDNLRPPPIRFRVYRRKCRKTALRERCVALRESASLCVNLRIGRLPHSSLVGQFPARRKVLPAAFLIQLCALT